MERQPPSGRQNRGNLVATIALGQEQGLVGPAEQVKKLWSSAVRLVRPPLMQGW
jgi:hypothetical protein